MSDTVIEGSVVRNPSLYLPAIKDAGLGENEDLATFFTRINTSLRRQQALAAWHIGMFAKSVGKIELPYSHNDTYMDASKHYEGYWAVDGVQVTRFTAAAKWVSELNVEATVEYLALVMKTARSLYPGLFIEKKYNNTDFNLKFTIPINAPDGQTEKVELTYYAKREAVCKKKVVGTEQVPEKVIPAHTKEIVEWDCEPVSLRAVGEKLEALNGSSEG